MTMGAFEKINICFGEKQLFIDERCILSDKICL